MPIQEKILSLKCAYKMLQGGIRLGIVIGEDDQGTDMGTMELELISSSLYVEHIIFLSQRERWTYWSKKSGIIAPLVTKDSITKEPIDAPTLDMAVEIAKGKYIYRFSEK